LTRRRAEVDEAQKPLLDELNQIKLEINEFDQKRTEVMVSSKKLTLYNSFVC